MNEAKIINLRKKQILVCITFRDFDGGINDKIQRLVLNSFKSQTYKNFKLVVSVYREKNIEKVLKEYALDYEIHNCKIKNNYSHSFSEVIYNAFSYLEKDKHIIYWSQADTVIDENFFEEVIKNYQENFSGISWPVYYYDSIENFNKGILSDNKSIFKNSPKKDSPYNNIFYKYFIQSFSSKNYFSIDANLWVAESFFIDGNSFLIDNNKSLIKKNKINGAYQGIINIIVPILFSNTKINIFYQSKSHEIKNDFGPDADWWNEVQNKPYFQQQLSNTQTLNNLIKDLDNNFKFNISGLFNKIYLHSTFSLIGNTFQKLIFLFYLFIWILNYFSFMVTRLFQKVFQKKISKN